MRQDAYQRAAQNYDRWLGSLTIALRHIGLKMYPPYTGMKVLDVGCGTGINLRLYQKNGCEVCGIDQSPAMLKIARQQLGDNPDLHLGDASELPYHKNSFDLVLSMLTLHEVSDTSRISIVNEMKRVTKPDGMILLIDYHPGPLQFPRGWIYRTVILFFEINAGGVHYQNYRRFMYHRGLPGIVSTAGLTVVKRKIVGGGNIALYLLKTYQDS